MINILFSYFFVAYHLNMYFMKPINHRNVVAKIAKDMKTVVAENTTLWIKSI